MSMNAHLILVKTEELVLTELLGLNVLAHLVLTGRHVEIILTSVYRIHA